MSKLKLLNNTISDNLIISINGNSFYLKKGDTAFIDVSQGLNFVKISLDKKHKVSVKWLNIFLSIAESSDARNIIYYDYTFEMMIQGDNCELMLFENNYRLSDSTKLKSIYADSTNCDLSDRKYIISSNGKNPKTKHTLLQIFLLSGIPWIIAGTIYSFFDFEVGVAIAIIILFFVATIPSIKSIKSFNKSLINGDDLLKTNIKERGELDVLEDVANKIIKDNETKGIVKILSRLFKKWINSI